MFPSRERGFSLLEVVAATVVMGLVFAGFVSVYGTVLRSGSDAVLQSQADGIAAAYLDEILAQPYSDPDDGAICGIPEASRAAFDNACDYDNLAQNGCTTVSGACPTVGSCACDRDGAPVDGLRGFGVSVGVTPASVGGVDGLRVRVTVNHDGVAGNGVTLDAFRTAD
ncbi:MAG: prepilin-type N-terminal cleavage/methylation domain-containing protein [Woeseiaceae bacterium]